MIVDTVTKLEIQDLKYFSMNILTTSTSHSIFFSLQLSGEIMLLSFVGRNVHRDHINFGLLGTGERSNILTTTE